MKNDWPNYRENLGLSASDKLQAGKAIMAGRSAAHFDDSEIPVVIVLGAMRCWCAAREAGSPPQPMLCEHLASPPLAILAPVFDSVMTIWEWAAKRRFAGGNGSSPSADETLLLDAFYHSGPIIDADRQSDAGHLLACAFHCARIVMKLAWDDRIAVDGSAVSPG